MKMRMRIAILFLTPMLLFRPISGSLMAAEPAKVAQPAIVFQVKSIEELSGILTATAKRFLPDDESKALEPVLSRWISKLKGVDSKKPLGIYATIGEELSKGDFSTSFIVILVPVSDQKAFLEYLGSLDLQTQKQEEEYELTPVPFPTSLKFRDGYAYFVIARGKISPSSLLQTENFFRDSDKSQARLEILLDRVPEDLKKRFVAGFQKKMEAPIAAARAKKGDETEPLTPERARATTELGTTLWGQRWVSQIAEEGKQLALRLDLDPKTGNLGLEMLVEAKSGTKLAKSIAGLQARSNVFTQIVAADSAAHMLVQSPLFIEEPREMLAFGVSAIGQEFVTGVKARGAKEMSATLTELHKALSRTIIDGKLDFASSLRGPDNNDMFTAVAALSLKGTAELEKEWRALAKQGPEGEIKLDAYQVRGMNVHEIPVGDRLPPDAQKVFGKSSLFIAFEPNAVFATFGPQGKEVMTEVLTAKRVAKPGPLMQMEISGKRIGRLWKTLGAPPEALAYIEKLPGETSTVMVVKLEGGSKMVLRLDIGLPALWVVIPKAKKSSDLENRK